MVFFSMDGVEIHTGQGSEVHAAVSKSAAVQCVGRT